MCIAVVDFIARHLARHRQGLGRDAGCQAGRVAHRIVAGQAGAVRQAGAADGNRLVAACVLVAEHARGAGQYQGFITHQTLQGTTRQAGRQGAVVDLVARGNASDGQFLRRDTGLQTGRIADRVIAGQASAVGQGRAAGSHGNIAGHILSGKRARQTGQRQGFTADQATQGTARHVRRKRAVIDLVARRRARHCQRFLRDGTCTVGRIAGQGVVARIRTAKHDTFDMHGFAAAGVLVAEGRLGGAERQAVAAQQAVERGAGIERGSVRAVIGLAGGRDASDAGNLRLRNGTRARAGGRRQVVVAGVGTAQGQAAGSDALAAAGVLVDEVGRTGADRQDIAVDHAGKGGAGAADAGLGSGVIHLVASDNIADAANIGFADIARAGGRVTDQGVVARVRAAQDDAFDIDGFAGSGVLVAEGRLGGAE